MDLILGRVSLPKNVLPTSEELFRLIFENTSIGIAVGYPTGRLIDCNGAFQRMLGYTKEELVGKLFSEFTHPEDAEKEWILVKEIESGKKDHYEIEKRYVRKDGEIFWGLTVSNPIRKQNKTVLAIASIEDISKRKNSEEELRQANQRFQAHMRNAPEAVIEFDLTCFV